MDIVIDAEFKALIHPLEPDEYERLEASILKEGCRDALVVWQGENILVDGHNRYEICTRHNLPYEIVYREFANREDAKNWMDENQLARRNINDHWKVIYANRIRGRIEAKAKENQQRFKGNQHVTGTLLESTKKQPVNTRKEIAKKSGTSEDKVYKVTKIEEKAPEVIRKKARKQEISTNQAYNLMKEYEKLPEPMRDKVASLPSGDNLEDVKALVKIAEQAPDKLDDVVTTIETGKASTVKEATDKANIQVSLTALQSSNTNEWYTPEQYIEAARLVMGSIDIDPASNPIANEVVKADTYYTIDTNGLDKDWTGNVWLNPPYGRIDGDSNQDIWSTRLIEQYEAGITKQAVLLVNAVTDRKWFQPLWNYTICFTDHRIRFYTPDKQPGQPTHGNVLVYFGDNVQDFVNHFSQFGVVVQRLNPQAQVQGLVA